MKVLLLANLSRDIKNSQYEQLITRDEFVAKQIYHSLELVADVDVCNCFPQSCLTITNNNSYDKYVLIDTDCSDKDNYFLNQLKNKPVITIFKPVLSQNIYNRVHTNVPHILISKPLTKKLDPGHYRSIVHNLSLNLKKVRVALINKESIDIIQPDLSLVHYKFCYYNEYVNELNRAECFIVSYRCDDHYALYEATMSGTQILSDRNFIDRTTKKELGVLPTKKKNLYHHKNVVLDSYAPESVILTLEHQN